MLPALAYDFDPLAYIHNRRIYIIDSLHESKGSYWQHELRLRFRVP